MWSMIDFIFVPYLLIAAFVYGTYNENIFAGIVASLWAGVLVIGYFIALRLFFLLIFAILFMITLVIPISEQISNIILEMIMTITKLSAIFLAESLIKGGLASDKLNFLDEIENPFVEKFKALVHLIILAGILIDIISLIKTGHRFLMS